MKTACSRPFLGVAAASLALLAGATAFADSTYQSAVLADGPHAYYRFGEAGVANLPIPASANIGSLGTTADGADVTTLFDDLVVRGLPGALADPANTAASFPGTTPGGDNYSSWISVPWNAGLAINGPFSVEFWAKPATTGFGTPTAFFQYTSPRSGWLLYQSDTDLAAGNGWVFRLYNGVNTTTIADAKLNMPLDTNQWYHIVAVYDGTNAKIYTNGLLAVSAARTGTYAPAVSTRSLAIGSRGVSGSAAVYGYAGLLDEYAFYGAALSADQVAAHFAAAATNATGYAAQILADHPVGYWRFNETFTPTVAHNSGSAGAALDGIYLNGSTTAPELRPPAQAGFDSANSVIQFPGASHAQVRLPALNLNTNTVTFETWVKCNGTQNQFAGLIFQRDEFNASSSANGFQFTQWGNGLGYSWAGDSSTWNWNSGIYLPESQWVYAALVISPSQAAIYTYDGSLWNAATNVHAHSAVAWANFTRLGDDTATDARAFNGLMDEVAIYRKALTPGQLRSHALAGFGDHNPPGLVTDPPVLSPSGFIYPGMAFTLTVDAYGAPPLTYQWRKDGIAIPGATGSTYTKTNVTTGASGSYDVVVTNPNGSATPAIPIVVTISDLPPDITSNLRLWLPFDGNANDGSGNNRNGTLQGFPEGTSQWVAGRTNGAIRVNPAGGLGGEVVLVTDNGGLEFSSTLEFSIAAWVNGSATSGALIAKGFGGGSEQYAVDVNNGAYRFFVRDAGGNATVYQTGIKPDGFWHHVVATFSAPLNIVKFYHDGAEVLSGTPPSSLLWSDHAVSIGSRQSGYDAFDLDYNGLIDDLRIYARALGPRDVAALYNLVPPLPPGIAHDLQSPRAVYPGGTVVLSAAVGGSPPLSYQWKHAGTNLPGATAATLTLASLDAAKTGNYSLTITNAAGSTNTAVATVSMLPLSPTSYEAAVVADSPEAYWRLEETAAGAILDSMGRHDGVSAGNVSFAGAGVLAGDSGYAMGFTGGYVQVPYSPALNTASFSVECWASLDDVPWPPASGQYYAPFASRDGNYDTGLHRKGYSLYVSEDGTWDFWTGHDSNWGFATGSAVRTNTWTHLVCTYDAVSLAQRLYINGVQAAVTFENFVPNLRTPFYIGSILDSGPYPFHGQIDEVSFYPSALSPERVSAHYQLVTSGTTNKPIVVQSPISQTVPVGTTVTLTALVAGASPMTYQWQKNGSNIPGATDLTLTLTNAYYTDAGQYQLLAVNTLGNAASAAAVLTVMPPESQTNLVVRAQAGTAGAGAFLELIWPAGTLYSAPAVTGPWSPVSGATLPYFTVSPTNAAMFFRCK